MSHAKPIDERMGAQSAVRILGGSGELVAPALPERLGKLPGDLRARWDELWTSPVAAVLDPVSDLEPMSRLFALYARERQFDEALGRQLSWLSGDPDMPFDPQFARVTLAISAEIRQLEQTLGVTPRGRLVIGAAVAAAGKGQQQAGGEHDDADD